MAKSGVYPVYENQFKVGESAEKSNVPADMESFSVNIDNGVEEWTPMNTEGWKRRLQTAKAISISVNGKRNVGDPGNDYIASKTFVNGRNAEGYFAWTFPDGTVVSWDNAIYSVSENSTGDSTAVAPLVVEIMSNGKPTITEPSASASGE